MSGKKINETERDLKKDVAKMKRRLTQQAKKRGMIWENFGQKEFRDLTDRYGRYLYDIEVDTKPIFDFEEWASNYVM